ncbi:MAG: hypothetical protein N2690_04875, partial [Rhodocyclaceae bacterium]|nr:hypothetical protein [Rhodocyclaceae bacterium]
MSRIAYTLAILLLLPWAVLHLLWRARRQPEYLAHWGERFGFFRGQDAVAPPSGRPKAARHAPDGANRDARSTKPPSFSRAASTKESPGRGAKGGGPTIWIHA